MFSIFNFQQNKRYSNAHTKVVFSSCKIFSRKCYFCERKIFLSVQLHYENYSRKYFHVFSNILKMLFSTTTHTKPTTTQQENHQNTTTHTTTTTTKKSEIKGLWVRGSIKIRERERERERSVRGFMARRLWVEVKFVGSQIDEVEGVIGKFVDR